MNYSIQNVINEIFNHHECSQDYFDEFDDESTINLCKKDIKIVKCLSNKQENNWTSKMMLNAVNIIKKYKNDIENILEINIDELNIDLDFFDLEKDSTLKIENNYCYLPIDFNEFNFFECKKNKDIICFPLNYNNIFLLTKIYLNKKLIINNENKKKISLYLNQINFENESINKIHNNKNYDISLLKFQEVGTTYGLLNKEIIIGDEMGLGKTVQALSIMSLSNSFPLIIVCPKSLKYKWEYECKKLKNIKTEVFSKNTNLKNLKENCIYIFTYEDIPKTINSLETNKNIKGIIFDESHFLKNRKTIRSKACKRLTKNPDYIIELSGSPILNRVSELLNQIDIIKKVHLFGCNLDFSNHYCQREKIYKREDIENFDFENDNIKLKELSHIMKSNFYIRRTKKNVLKELPNKRRDFIYVDIENKKEYNQTLNEIKKETDLKKKKQLLSSLKRIAAEGKFKSIKEQIEDHISNNEKVVIFAYHKKMQERLCKEFPDALKVLREQNDQERFQAQEEFLNNKDKLVIICSIKVAYAGFDFYSASQMIFAEMDWTPEINKQCEDRIHRIGQRFPVNITYIIAKNTIEERILKVNVEKLKVINEVNQETDDFIVQKQKNSIKDEILDQI